MKPAGIVVGPPLNPAAPSPKKEQTVAERIIEIISDRTGVEPKHIKRDDKLVKDLGAKPNDLVAIRKDVAKKFDIKIPADSDRPIVIAVAGVTPSNPVPDDDFKKISTVGEMIDYVEKAVRRRPRPRLRRWHRQFGPSWPA